MNTPNPNRLATTDTLRNATLNDLVTLLHQQADIKFDAVVNAASLSYHSGLLAVDGAALGDFDVQDVINGNDKSTSAVFRPTIEFEDDIAGKLAIPSKYVRRMRDDAVRAAGEWTNSFDATVIAAPADNFADLLDHNVNHWLQHDPARRFLLRAFKGEHGIGVARALLSDRFAMIDNLDVLLAALDGARQANAGLHVTQCDLTPNRMSVTIEAPEVQTLAPLWLRGYQSPFDDDNGGAPLARWRRIAHNEGLGYEPGSEPIVHAGLKINNSETGGGKWRLVPFARVRICRNGLTIDADAMEGVHLGGVLESGVVKFSDDTQQKNKELIVAKARDAVASFLDADYLTSVIARIEEKSQAKVSDPQKIVQQVSKRFDFTEAEEASILSAFISSGQVNAGGVLNAVTAVAQTIEDGERAAELESAALDVLDFVASASNN